ncbi:MAG: porin [Thiobacillus sp.]
MKKILAIAIASAFAAPAFAATANVDIYGAMNVSVDRVDADGAANESRGRVSSNNSHIGFKGAEDLGGGLSAVWQFEYAIQLDQQGFNQASQAPSNSQGATSLRNTFAGLSSKSLGSLTFGTQESPLKISTGPLAVFGDTLADYRSVFTKLSTRSDNSVLYTSPNMSGFQARAMYGMRNEAGNGAVADPRMYALSGVYKNGPLYATLAYENNRNVAASTTGYTTTCNPEAGPFPITPTCTTTTTTTTALANKQANAWRAGVGYTFFSDLKLGLAYEKNDVENAAGATINDGHAWYASAAYQMGNIGLKASYTDRGDYTSGADNGAKQYVIGADYGFSKRTSVYALYTKVSNDTNGTNGIGPSTGIATVGTVAGGDASGVSLGMVHKF